MEFEKGDLVLVFYKNPPYWRNNFWDVGHIEQINDYFLYENEITVTSFITHKTNIDLKTNIVKINENPEEIIKIMNLLYSTK